MNCYCSREKSTENKTRENFKRMNVTLPTNLPTMVTHQLFSGLHKVLAMSLVSPCPEYRLQELDMLRLEVLKQGLVSPSVTCSKPMTVIAKSLQDPRQFKEQLDSCQLEVIGTTKGRPFFIFRGMTQFPPKNALSLFACRSVQVRPPTAPINT